MSYTSQSPKTAGRIHKFSKVLISENSFEEGTTTMTNYPAIPKIKQPITQLSQPHMTSNYFKSKTESVKAIKP